MIALSSDPSTSPTTTFERMNSTFPAADVLFVPIEYANITSLLLKFPTALPLTSDRDNVTLLCAIVNGETENPFQLM
jgi:hypothetical protein